MSLREEQCKKICRILDDVLANRPTERDSLIVAVQLAFESLSEPHWIPVTKKLPDKDERDYWICTDGGYQCQCRWTDDIGFGHHDMWRWSGNPQYSKVIAWMPLPEPYKGVTE